LRDQTTYTGHVFAAERAAPITENFLHARQGSGENHRTRAFSSGRFRGDSLASQPSPEGTQRPTARVTIPQHHLQFPGFQFPQRLRGALRPPAKPPFRQPLLAQPKAGSSPWRVGEWRGISDGWKHAGEYLQT
jgi:hypothetical protein